ncbi:hypothetical protein A2164_01345 [Candidatus Curtissbacteria bacterium RBG_13_35_7]|uniref:Fido domain-containing protein n=1 Tax=Candidatus Curtissbacteria bacterium RBG_13_35_7 TaxID=1797705 RepID=A0A1F5G4S4_9BACT|nr:MAG: hypothetical protein A2164_01345 [Candidatus Curtissbacteria bacterium RBG_13_35_7]
MKTKYVSLEDVLFFHEMIIEASGGKAGISDFTLFHSAIARPQASFAGKDLYKAIFEKTAACVHSLLLNHPFNDGNKRTALAVGERFLNINGYEINASQKEKVKFTLDIEAKKLDLPRISGWLKKHSKKSP